MNDKQREELFSNVLSWIFESPTDQCNSTHCPLFEVRQLPPDGKSRWLQRLSDTDLEYFNEFHRLCLDWMFVSDPKNI